MWLEFKQQGLWAMPNLYIFINSLSESSIKLVSKTNNIKSQKGHFFLFLLFVPNSLLPYYSQITSLALVSFSLLLSALVVGGSSFGLELEERKRERWKKETPSFLLSFFPSFFPCPNRVSRGERKIENWEINEGTAEEGERKIKRDFVLPSHMHIFPCILVLVIRTVHWGHIICSVHVPYAQVYTVLYYTSIVMSYLSNKVVSL